MRIIFDANFGRPLIVALRGLIRFQHSPPEVCHIYERFEVGVADDVWIPALLEEGWMIVSGDRGRGKPRLPQICREMNRTHIILSPAIHRADQFEKARAFLSSWPQILKIAEGPAGARYIMQYTGPGREHVRLREKSFR